MLRLGAEQEGGAEQDGGESEQSGGLFTLAQQDGVQTNEVHGNEAK